MENVIAYSRFDVTETDDLNSFFRFMVPCTYIAFVVCLMTRFESLGPQMWNGRTIMNNDFEMTCKKGRCGPVQPWPHHGTTQQNIQ
jgi:hypothetical protein